MNIEIKKLRLEILAEYGGLIAALHFEVANRDVRCFQLSGLSLSEFEKVKEICKNKKNAVLHMRNEKLKPLCEWKLNQFSEEEILIVDKISDEKEKSNGTMRSPGVGWVTSSPDMVLSVSNPIDEIEKREIAIKIERERLEKADRLLDGI